MVRYFDPEKDSSRGACTLSYSQQKQRRKKRQEIAERARVQRAELSYEDAFEKAKQDAFTILDYMARSRKDLIERLAKKGYQPDVCADVATRCEELGVINDRELAYSLLRDRFERKGVVGKALYQELFRKGIPHAIAQEIVHTIDSDAVATRCDELVAKRARALPEGLSDDKIRQRLTAFLMRKGYSFDQINHSISSYFHSYND
ncbi:MAG: regulatory protein RecX [Actinomycetaceae bacterium]|nr:regulatory protein RecX [Actinomycetaceae bacterium]